MCLTITAPTLMNEAAGTGAVKNKTPQSQHYAGWVVKDYGLRIFKQKKYRNKKISSVSPTYWIDLFLHCLTVFMISR